MMEYYVTEAEAEETIAYGVALRGSPLAAPGLTESLADAQQLAALLTELQVEPCHFWDIVEDYLTDFRVV